jgi:hypothetical protein
MKVEKEKSAFWPGMATQPPNDHQRAAFDIRFSKRGKINSAPMSDQSFSFDLRKQGKHQQ